MTPKEFEKKVMEIENVRIVVRADLNAVVGDYTYKKMAADNISIKEWMDTRIWPLTNKFDVVVLDGKASPDTRKSTNMGTLRNTYASE